MSKRVYSRNLNLDRRQFQKAVLVVEEINFLLNQLYETLIEHEELDESDFGQRYLENNGYLDLAMSDLHMVMDSMAFDLGLTWNGDEDEKED